MKQKPTGTREWASVNYNIQTRCEHGCVYCYACANAMRFGRCESHAEWGTVTPTIDMNKVHKKWRKAKGTIMFPTTHDITILNLEQCETALAHMLEAGNNVLIVTKPHLACVRDICENFEAYKDLILWRFTIGSSSSDNLRFWEPGAPDFMERLESVALAFRMKYETSISSEPYLDNTIHQLIQLCDPYVTQSHWLGPMNKMETRVAFRDISYKDAAKHIGDFNYIHSTMSWTKEEWCHWNEAKLVQTEDYIKMLYDTYKSNPKIKFKNRIKEVLGLEIPEDIGMDV